MLPIFYPFGVTRLNNSKSAFFWVIREYESKWGRITVYNSSMERISSERVSLPFTPIFPAPLKNFWSCFNRAISFLCRVILKRPSTRQPVLLRGNFLIWTIKLPSASTNPVTNQGSKLLPLRPRPPSAAKWQSLVVVIKDLLAANLKLSFLLPAEWGQEPWVKDEAMDVS